MKWLGILKWMARRETWKKRKAKILRNSAAWKALKERENRNRKDND